MRAMRHAFVLSSCAVALLGHSPRVDRAPIDRVPLDRAWPVFVRSRAFTTGHSDSTPIVAIAHVAITDSAYDRGSPVRKFVFTPAELTVAPGTIVFWHAPQPTYDGADSLGPAVQVVFDDPTAADSARVPFGGTACFAAANFLCTDHGDHGNMTIQAAPERLGVEARLFTRRGRYTYHSPEGGSGTIVVQ